MKLSASDYNNLSYLLKKNALSHNDIVEWAYSNFTEDGVDKTLERISLTDNSRELTDLISEVFHVYGEPTSEFLAGEAAIGFFDGSCSMYDAICRLLFDLDLEEDETKRLYIAEDYFGWHNFPEVKAIKIAKPIFLKYGAAYERAIKIFSV